MIMNLGPDAPYQRVGFGILKWHTRVQKSGKSPPRAICMSKKKCEHILKSKITSEANQLINCTQLEI